MRILTLLAAGLLSALLALGAYSPATAQQGWSGYSANSFAAAQAAGETIVVDVHADWCPTCRAQQPILNEIRSDKRAANVRFIKVNFDDDKAFLRAHRVPRQSTILVFKGEREVARSIAETDRTRLRKIVFDAI